MRVFVAILLAAASTACAKAESVWSASCSGQNQIQYLQTINGDGYLHIGQSDGSYMTIKLKQTFFNGKTVCGSTTAKAAANEVAAICADNESQAIRLVFGSQLAKGLRPEKAPVYCQGVVTTN